MLTQPMLNFSLYDTKATKRATQENDDLDDNEEDDVEDDDAERQNNDFDQNGSLEDGNDYETKDAIEETPRASYLVSLKLFGIHTK